MKISILAFAAVASILHAAPKSATPPGPSFYTQSVDASGITIRASDKVERLTLEAVRQRIAHVLSNAPAIAANMKAAKVEMHVFARSEVITDLPEFQVFRNRTLGDGETFEHRYHGGKATGMLVACGEENVMRDESNPYPKDYDVCTHELAHAVFSVGLDSAARQRVVARYQAALDEGLYEGQYAAQSFDEFFAEGSAHYFGFSGGGLRGSDPSTYALLDSFYSGAYAPVSSPVVDLVPLAGAALETAHSTGPGGALTAGVFLRNTSTSDVRVSQLDSAGHILASTSEVIAAGSVDAPGFSPGTTVLVTDDKTKGIVAAVAVQNDMGRLTVTDKMVRAQKPPTADQLARASGPTRL